MRNGFAYNPQCNRSIVASFFIFCIPYGRDLREPWRVWAPATDGNHGMPNIRASLVTKHALLFAANPRGATPRMANLGFDSPVAFGATIAVIGAVVAFLLPRRKSR
jgi:hypothetical protein